MSGVRLPSEGEKSEITRIRDRITREIVARENNHLATAQAALLVWVGLVSMDGDFTREQARTVANAVIDAYIIPKGN